ncbi:MAG: nucleoside triphosphate pyrophosphohydrolase [Candidatus Micrarchaeota archaeon]|nr:nucleoside triphosphate pyrophosphohydrolase [Candidatus Micrarchaeota archaeon]
MEGSKLVRDKIPEIIRQSGRKPMVHIADQKEYAMKLRTKLVEESEEYISSHSPEELADILEVVYALAALDKIDPSALGRMRLAKAKKRGSFRRKIVLDGIEK